jgi:hypothetical protein
MSESEQPNPVAAPVEPTRRERLKFTDFQFRRFSDGRCVAQTEFEWLDGVKVRGEASGQSSPTVDLRVAAEAALRAIETFSEGSLAFELIGVKSVRAFDANVVIVSIANKRPEGPRRLLGSALVEADPARGAVVAVLTATNRVLGNFIATR